MLIKKLQEDIYGNRLFFFFILKSLLLLHSKVLTGYADWGPGVENRPHTKAHLFILILKARQLKGI